MLPLLNLMSSKEDYDKYRRFIKKHTVTKEVYTILDDMDSWYKVSDTLDWDKFQTWFCFVRHATMKEDALDVYKSIFAAMKEYEPDESDDAVIETIISRDYATQVAEYAHAIADGKPDDLTKVEDMLDSYRDTLGKTGGIEEKIITTDMTELFEDSYAGGGYEWRLNELNLSLGPLRVGDFITLAARPDSGKTTFLASEATHITEQTGDLLTLWFCNEERGKRVGWRIAQAALGISAEEYESDSLGYTQKYRDLLGDRIKVIHEPGMHISLVKEALTHFKGKVGLIVLDQLWQMEGFRDVGNEVERQMRLFSWARTLTDHAPVLNVHQAGGTAEGMLYFEMNHLYGSQTAIQGACDVVLCLGKPHDPAYSSNTRGLYAPKNKLSGGPSADPAMKNARFEVEIQPQHARFTGVL